MYIINKFESDSIHEYRKKMNYRLNLWFKSCEVVNYTEVLYQNGFLRHFYIFSKLFCFGFKKILANLTQKGLYEIFTSPFSAIADFS